MSQSVAEILDQHGLSEEEFVNKFKVDSISVIEVVIDLYTDSERLPEILEMFERHTIKGVQK